MRVPRTNMPMRFVELSRDGQLTRSPEANPRVSYVTMLGVRAMLVGSAGPILGRACVVAVRYSAVRRQGFNSEGSQKEEYQVVDSAAHARLMWQVLTLLPRMAGARLRNAAVPPPAVTRHLVRAQLDRHGDERIHREATGER